MNKNYPRIYAVVKKIPKGRVATYGQVARLAKIPRHARQVGYALHALPDAASVPWHRVVNAQGEISKRAEPHFEIMQRSLLKAEQIIFNPNNRISLKDFQWKK